MRWLPLLGFLLLLPPPLAADVAAAVSAGGLPLGSASPPPHLVPHSPSRLNNSGVFDANTGESSLFMWSGGGPQSGRLTIFETINSKYPGMAFGPRVSYYRLRDLDSGEVVANITASKMMGFGSAFVDHDHGRLWLFGCYRGKGCAGTGTPPKEPLPGQGSVHALWSTDLVTWHGPVLTDVALAAPNAVVARVRGKTHRTLPSHRYVMVTEGLSVALCNATDGNLTRGWTSEPPIFFLAS
jgi:hypothetical protein